ncbi:MAG TPA: hypothetical protein HPP54_10485 [Nitrospinae bacterium]|nr:hypothetical protein [Nitrospinota bacterium]
MFPNYNNKHITERVKTNYQRQHHDYRHHLQGVRGDIRDSTGRAWTSQAPTEGLLADQNHGSDAILIEAGYRRRRR